MSTNTLPHKKSGRLHQLVRCIRYLGVQNGWRYFKLGEAARKNPNIVLLWINELEATAMIEELSGNWKLSQSLQGFAEEMKQSHRAYGAANASGQAQPESETQNSKLP